MNRHGSTAKHDWARHCWRHAPGHNLIYRLCKDMDPQCGLRHISNDTYRCFLAIETIIYKLIVAGKPKDKVMTEVVGDENVRFLWEIATDLSNEKLQLSLLQEATKEWFILRGFSVASQLLEQYI